MKVITFSNHKGGVAKTTCAFNTAVALTRKGYRVLGVDIDQQGNFSDSCGINLEELEVSQMNSLRLMLYDTVEPKDYIIHSREKLDVIPCSLDDDAETLISGLNISRELRLRKKLIPIRKQYDFCIIDTPPNLGIVTINALAFSDLTIVPILPSRYALLGIKQVLRKISQVQADHAPNMLVMALMTRFIERQSFDKLVREQVIKRFTESLVFSTSIPKAVAIEEASATQESILDSDDASGASFAFMRFTKELLEVLGLENEEKEIASINRLAQ